HSVSPKLQSRRYDDGVIICEFHTILTDGGVSVFSVYFIFNIINFVCCTTVNLERAETATLKVYVIPNERAQKQSFVAAPLRLHSWRGGGASKYVNRHFHTG
ncbi:hypothetical protein L9F63_005273, partial [Diploptera punctata]